MSELKADHKNKLQIVRHISVERNKIRGYKGIRKFFSMCEEHQRKSNESKNLFLKRYLKWKTVISRGGIIGSERKGNRQGMKNRMTMHQFIEMALFKATSPLAEHDQTK